MLILQLIEETPSALQISFNYFNGTDISTFAIPALTVLYVSLGLHLNDSDFVVLSLRPSLRYCHRLLDGFS